MKKPSVHFHSCGRSGNIFCILGMVKTALTEERRITDYNDIWSRVQETHSYEDALAVIREKINLVDLDRRY